jgi:hypothetical protein
LILLNGSRELFKNFDRSKIGSGERVSNEEGDFFFFICNLKGAYFHVRQKLRCVESGYIHVCRVDDKYIQEASENTDSAYHGKALVVKSIHDAEIEIIESIPTSNLLNITLGSAKNISISTEKTMLGDTGIKTYLSLIED